MNNLLKLRSLAAPQPTTGGGGNNPSGANAHASASTKRGAVPAPPHRLPLQVPAPTSGKRLRHSERRRQQNREASARFRERGKQRQSELAELQQDIQKVGRRCRLWTRSLAMIAVSWSGACAMGSKELVVAASAAAAVGFVGRRLG
eukprot:scaffold8031_cov471-Prasinococcus_capsulatus_cf.AAC.2